MEENIQKLIQILLATEPAKKFETDWEERAKKHDEIYGHERDIRKRVLMWDEKDENEKERIKDRAERMVQYLGERLKM